MKEVYLPFYVTTASLRSELASAELGFQEWGTVFNPTRRRFERQLVVNWRPAIFDVVRGLCCSTPQGSATKIRGSRCLLLLLRGHHLQAHVMAMDPKTDISCFLDMRLTGLF